MINVVFIKQFSQSVRAFLFILLLTKHTTAKTLLITKNIRHKM